MTSCIFCLSAHFLSPLIPVYISFIFLIGLKIIQVIGSFPVLICGRLVSFLPANSPPQAVRIRQEVTSAAATLPLYSLFLFFIPDSSFQYPYFSQHKQLLFILAVPVPEPVLRITFFYFLVLPGRKTVTISVLYNCHTIPIIITCLIKTSPRLNPYHIHITI